MLIIYSSLPRMFKEKKTLISFSSKYFIRRSAFSYFFSGHYKNHINIFNRFFYPNKNAIMSFLPKINFTGFFNHIYEDYRISKNIIFASKNLLNSNMRYLRYTQYYFNRYMQFQYFMYILVYLH